MIGRTSSWIGTQKPMWNRSFAGLRWGASGQAWNPRIMGSLPAWYDISDLSSLIYDGSNRVSLVSDKSGNSAVNCLVLNGAAGNYASAPDSGAVSVTGDIDLRASVALNDWTPSASNVIIAKWTETGNQRSYLFWVATSGALELFISTTGADTANVTSSVAPTVSDFGTIWVRVTRVQSTGIVTFFTSSNGVTWTQLGTTQVLSAGSAIFDSTSVLEVGSRNTGAQTVASGRIYRAQIYNGIAGTIAFDANFATASKLATSFTESSSNAATVTINTSGATGARISGERDLYQGTVANQPILTVAASGNYLTFDGSNDYLKAPAFALSQPETVYFCGSQVSWTGFDRVWNDGAVGWGLEQNNLMGSPNVMIRGNVNDGNIGSWSLQTNAVLTTVLNATASSNRLNRTTAIAATGLNSTALAGFALGCRADGASNYGNITASEIIIYSAAHTTAQQDRVIQHLSRKWKIAV